MNLVISVLAVLMGVTTSFILARLRFQHLLLVVYHLPYRFWRSYKVLYEEAETTFTYKMIGTKEYKNHKDFLGHYEKLKPRIETSFKRLWNSYAYFVIRDYTIVLTASGALFFWSYFAFIGPFLGVQLGYWVYIHFYKKRDFYLFKVFMIEAVMKKR